MPEAKKELKDALREGLASYEGMAMDADARRRLNQDLWRIVDDALSPSRPDFSVEFTGDETVIKFKFPFLP